MSRKKNNGKNNRNIQNNKNNNNKQNINNNQNNKKTQDNKNNQNYGLDLVFIDDDEINAAVADMKSAKSNTVDTVKKSTTNATTSTTNATTSTTNATTSTTNAAESTKDNSAVSKKSKGFVTFLVSYSAILIILIFAGLYYIWNMLYDYEASLPEVNMEKHIVDFNQDNIGNLLAKYPVEISKYDKYDDVVAIFKEAVKDDELSYKKNKKYTSEKPSYRIFSGEMPIADLTFGEVGKNGHNFSVWDIEYVDFEGFVLEKENIRIKVPSSANVIINGIAADESLKVGSEEVEMTEDIEQFVSYVPTYDIYEIDGLIASPNVTVEGINATLTEDENYDFAYSFPEDESVREEIETRAIALAKSYATYLIKKGDLSIAHNYSVGNAQKNFGLMGTNVFYLWNEEYTYQFSDEAVSNIIRYSDDLISCDTVYLLTVTYRGNRQIEYHTKISGMYVKQNDKWYMANFSLDNLE